ncbi:rhodanese-like domain-containing protein [Nonomuraea sp. NPDC049152]|uniref:rhodanese-like domain-containing protein n=1 Tax=Nonomuraea sp. NPDC049152 TaxID=3154350 RepID=UPI0033E3A7BA
MSRGDDGDGPHQPRGPTRSARDRDRATGGGAAGRRLRRRAPARCPHRARPGVGRAGRAGGPDRTATVVVYCSGPYCNRSKIAAAAFVRLGYADVRVYAGGKQDWAEAGLAFEGGHASAGVGRPA